MNSNLSKKIKFVLHILKHYPEGYRILASLLLKIPVSDIRVDDSIVIYGKKDSLLLEIIDEIFFQKVYNPKLFAVKKGDVVLDVGANIGVFSLYAVNSGAAHVYAVEPHRPNVKQIKTNLKKNNIQNVSVLPLGLSDKKGRVPFFTKEHDAHGSLYKTEPKGPNNRANETYINVTTLEELLHSYKIKKVNFLKMDIEGSEFKIIPSTTKPVWDKVERIALEYHTGISKKKYGLLIYYLESAGFVVNTKVIDPTMGYIYGYKF